MIRSAMLASSPHPARIKLLATVAIGAVLSVWSPPAEAQQSRSAGTRDHPHSEPTDREIVVAGHLPTDFSLLDGTDVLAGDELLRELKPQIGDMLTSLPGVSSTSFAPGASRPVIRGFDAERVQVLIDGIGTIDASSVSADHAVSLDTMTIDHIDVIHGPAVLLFGGQAIGGAVNVVDKRIPRRVPEQPEVSALASVASATRERSVGASIDVPVADRLVAHVDASWRKTGDLRIGGRAVSASLRDELLHEAEHAAEDGDDDLAEELAEAAELRGRVPNTQTRSSTLGAGIAFIDSGGSLGVSVQRYDSRYGIAARPGAGGHGHGEDHGEGHHHHHEDVSIDLGQTRFDFRGSLELGGFLERLHLRAAYGDYNHVELEGDEIGTRFDREGLEGRLELVQARRGAWHGHLGMQFASRSLDVEGAEAIVPNNDDTRFGVFTLQGFDFAGFSLEGAGRFERVTVRATEIGFRRSFDLWSGALGASISPAEGFKLGGSYLHGARAPSPEELLSDGLHIATQAYEIGDPSFTREESDSFELYARYAGSRGGFSVTAFATDFDDFIAAVPTGEEVEGFPVFRFAQLPARFRGIEAEAHFTAKTWADGGLRLEGGADYVRARLKDAGPVPRIPPLRLRGAAEAEWGELALRSEVEWNDRQTRVGSGESPVPGFTLVNASATWRPMGKEGPLTLILAGENLFDVVGRRAASFTRDYVPIAGRDIRLTASLRF